MANNPTSMRYPFESQISGLAPEVQQVHRNVWNAIVDIQNAVKIVHANNTANTTTLKTVTETVNTSNASSAGVSSFNSQNGDVSYYPFMGSVNNQAGTTSYSTASTDGGAVVIFNDASPIAVTLSTPLGVPWYTILWNEGVGTVTVTPASGTISYGTTVGASSMPILSGYYAFVYYDGTNWQSLSLPIVPVNTSSVAHEFFTAYNAVTGIFSIAQPAFTDISGVASPSQLPTPTASSIGGVEAAGPTAHEWIDAIDTGGVPHLSQPAFSDISGTASPIQLPIATTSALGAVKPDGTTITVTSGGVISAVGGSGTVTAVSVATANGFEGTSSGGATPSLTLNVDSTHVLPVNTGSATEYLNEAGGYSVPAGAGTTTDALTAAASGGAAPGATFNGSAAVTIDYHTVGADVAGAAAAVTLSSLGGVSTSTTVNGHALSSNVVVSASDLTTGTLPHAQLPTLLSGDIPNNAANTTGTASNAIDVNGASIPTSAKALASNASNQIIAATLSGSGAGLTTGPTTSTTGDVATFTGTGGQVADSGTLLTALAPKASPTFTGSVTLPLTTAGVVTTTSGGVIGSKSLAGSGSAIPTGPTSSTSGDLVSFTGTSGQIADSGVAANNVALLNAANTFTQHTIFSNATQPQIEISGGGSQNGIELDSVGLSPAMYLGAGNSLLVPGDIGFNLYDITHSRSPIFYHSDKNVIGLGEALSAPSAVSVASLGTGTVYSNSGTLTNTNPSDKRLKTNIQTLPYGLAEILKLKPVEFDWKEDKVHQGKQFGFIAQDVQKVMPEAVKPLGETDLLGLDKDAIYAALVNAVKAQQKQIEVLQKRIDKFDRKRVL